MGDKPEPKRRITRRGFLLGLPVGVLGALAVGLVSGKAVGSLLGRRGQADPPSDSIFSPSKDRYPRA